MIPLKVLPVLLSPFLELVMGVFERNLVHVSYQWECRRTGRQVLGSSSYVPHLGECDSKNTD